MKVGGLTSIFEACIVHFLAFWRPGKFVLKKALGLTNVTLSYRFFLTGAPLRIESKKFEVRGGFHFPRVSRQSAPNLNFAF